MGCHCCIHKKNSDQLIVHICTIKCNVPTMGQNVQECTVCLNDVEIYQKSIKFSVCKHIFHLECYKDLSKFYNTCPNCRRIFCNSIV